MDRNSEAGSGLKKMLAPRRWMFATVILMLVVATGCQAGMLFMPWYVWKGNLTEPEHMNLFKEKKVVVVCRPQGSDLYNYPTVPKNLARVVGKLLRDNGKKIEVVPYSKVDDWVDNNSWYTDFIEVGEAMKADYVLGIDLAYFTARECNSQTLKQGNARLRFEVIDCKTGDIVFEDTIGQFLYPPNSPRSDSETTESEFVTEYVELLADRIGRNFYAYDPHTDIAMDHL